MKGKVEVATAAGSGGGTEVESRAGSVIAGGLVVTSSAGAAARVGGRAVGNTGGAGMFRPIPMVNTRGLATLEATLEITLDAMALAGVLNRAGAPWSEWSVGHVARVPPRGGTHPARRLWPRLAITTEGLDCIAQVPSCWDLRPVGNWMATQGATLEAAITESLGCMVKVPSCCDPQPLGNWMATLGSPQEATPAESLDCMAQGPSGCDPRPQSNRVAAMGTLLCMLR